MTTTQQIDVRKEMGMLIAHFIWMVTKPLQMKEYPIGPILRNILQFTLGFRNQEW
jgi:hypothetical protein